MAVTRTSLISIVLTLAVFSHVTSYVINADETRVTCWTCPNKGNNDECNDWAPDRFCPINNAVCQTVHRFNVISGQSLQVDKRCVLPTECVRDHVGCHVQDKSMICVSCCNQSYCNRQVPHNNVTAIRLSVTVLGSSSSNASVRWTILVLVAILPLALRI